MGLRCNHVLGSQSQLTCTSYRAGGTVAEVSTVLNLQAATSKRGIDAVQRLIGDADLRRLELHMLGQAIQKHTHDFFKSEEGAEVVCTMLGKLV